MEAFEDNVFLLAELLVTSYLNESEKQLVVDLSAGRGAIRQALSRAAEIAVDLIQSYHDTSYYIIAAIRSKNKPVLSYKIGQTAIPDDKDVELLLSIDEPLTQTSLAR